MRYKSSFGIFLKNSDEKNKEISLLKSFLIKKKFDSLLDIGAGTGEIVKAVGNKFKSVELIEKNGHFIKNCMQTGFKVHYATFQQIKIDKKYNLIIASHLLPYLRNKNFHLHMDKIFKALSDKGYFISFEMTLDGKIGKFKKNIFERNIISTYEYLIEYLCSKNINYSEKKFKVNVMTDNFEEMYVILRFFSEKYEDEFEKNSRLTKDFISKELLDNRSKKYKLSYTNKMIIAKKYE